MSATLQKPDWVEARAYQRRAIASWLDNGGHGILQMATGTGKTVTALQAATELAQRLDNRLALFIAVPYQHLVDQWAEDLDDFGTQPVLAYQSRKQWQEQLERELVEFNMGSRSSVVVITTHDTFAMEPFQAAIDRVSGVERMLIADEVHHLGAPHRRDALPESIKLRLGLSATPKRWYDDEGTADLFDYFGGVVFEYGLEQAIENDDLAEYYYVPHVVELTPDETKQYMALSRAIGKLISKVEGDLSDADLQGHQELKQLLFKRARLIGTAANKLERLESLLSQTEQVKHTLVYCGDGSVDDSVSGETKRHVDATVTRLRDNLDINAHRFTARENQATREELLTEFERGDLDALVAIRCLDEGIDVPATQTAYILASSSNPRQFVQRRGRILRTHPGKEYAVIHDFITIPQTEIDPTLLDDDQFNAERNLLRKELERVATFAGAARNHPDADIQGIPSSSGPFSLQELKRQYNLLQM
ncbi:DEAD/DEAH box helicase family protein [Halorhabdus tiamatea]|nr:DEAD/DEAH box helicase family protein [Halorhabdus tiamatea]